MTEIISFGGHHDGEDLFNVQTHTPEAYPSDVPASEAQKKAISAFSGVGADELTSEQVHILLTYRDLARGCVDRLYPEAFGRRAHVIAFFIAAFISRDRYIASEAQMFMERRFDRAADPDDLPKALGRFKFIIEIDFFIRHELDRLRREGAVGL